MVTPKAAVKTLVKDVLIPRFKQWSYDHVFMRVYRHAARKPLDHMRAVFIENSLDAPSDNMRLVWDELTRRGFTCEFRTLERLRTDNVTYYRNCIAMIRAVATARVVFICEAIGPLGALQLREGTDVVQLWHGCGAFKRFGMSAADKMFGESREYKLRNPEHGSTTLVTVSSPEVRWAYIEAMCMEDRPEVVKALGVSRTDVFFDEGYVEACRKKVMTVVPATAGKKVILYAPTFRGEVATATAPRELDIELMYERLGRDYVLLVKHHPHVHDLPPMPASCSDFAFDVTKSLTIEECLCVADVCISDYSSLVFEYSLFGRPMVFFAFDRDEYDEWRGFYYDYDELTPGPVVSTTEEVVAYVENLEERFDPQVVAAFREKYMSACDGCATKRILASVLGDEAH